MTLDIKAARALADRINTEWSDNACPACHCTMTRRDECDPLGLCTGCLERAVDFLPAALDRVEELERERNETGPAIPEHLRLNMARVRTTIDGLIAERDAARAEVERMRPVVEAAEKWHDMERSSYSSSADYAAEEAGASRTLLDAVDAFRAGKP